MRLSGVTGHRVFVQDSDRPGTGIMSIYTIHRRSLGKPEKKFKFAQLRMIYLSKTNQGLALYYIVRVEMK